MDKLRCIAHGWTVFFLCVRGAVPIQLCLEVSLLESEEGFTNGAGRDRPFYTPVQDDFPSEASKSRTGHKEWFKHKETETETDQKQNAGEQLRPADWSRAWGFHLRINKDIAHV
jgi:hypothetical protein